VKEKLMRNLLQLWRLFIPLAATVIGFVVTTCPAQTTPEYGIRDNTPNLKAFINGRIVVSPQVQLDSGILVIEDDHITAAGVDVDIPHGATVVDLKRRTIYPGFIDPYTNYGVEKPGKRPRGEGGPQYTADRVGGNALNAAIHAERNWVTDLEPDNKAAEELRSQGFAAVQSVRKDGIFRGRAVVATLGEGLPNDLVLRPYSWHCASFDKGSSRQAYPGSLMGSIALIRQTLYDLDWYNRAHSAYELNASQELPEFNAALEALAAVVNEMLIFETDHEQSLLRAEKIADEFGIPFIHVGSGREYASIDEVAATDATMILPVAYPETPKIETIEDELGLTLAQLRHWERAATNPGVVEGAGIGFALTTHGLKKPELFLENVREAVKRGLSKQQALRSLTTIPAQICDVADQVGTLDPGKLANFFISEGDIFEDEAAIYSVWIQGKEYEVEPLPEVDPRGDYQLNLRTHEMMLSITGSPTKPNGKYEFGSSKGKLDDLEIDKNRLTFAITLDTLAYDGVLRFLGRLEDDTFAGQCLLPDGDLINWSAARVAPFQPEADTVDSDTLETLVSRLSYPNKAYGFFESPRQQDVLIRNVNVWTSADTGLLENTDVLVRDGKFAAIGPELVAPVGVEVIDAAGKHLTAGIIDAHSHIAIAGDVNECTEAITAEVRIEDVVDNYDVNIYRQLAAGVTMAHILHGSCNPIGGQVEVIKLKWGKRAEELKYDPAPPSIKFALGENVKQSNWGDDFRTRYPQSRLGVEAIIRDAFQAAREYEDKWERYSALGKSEKSRTIPPRRDLQWEPLVETLNSRMWLACHAYVQSEMLMLIRLAAEYGFQVRSFEHGLEAYKIAPEIAAAGVGVATFPDWWAYKFEVYDAIPHNAALLTEAGAVTAIKSDSPEMARRLPQEAAKSIMYADMSEEEALNMVTINAAEILMVDDRVGSVEIGKDADFVIWNGHPLSIFSKPEQTWIEGHKYFNLETDLKMREEIKSEKNALIQKVYRNQDGAGKGYTKPSSSGGDYYDPGAGDEG
jgi:imidazolonepropionase-like amidohydrolase